MCKVHIAHSCMPCKGLTSCWLVSGSIVQSVVAEETMKQLHGYRTPGELHRTAWDLQHFYIKTSRGRCVDRKIRAGSVPIMKDTTSQKEDVLIFKHHPIWLNCVCTRHWHDFIFSTSSCLDKWDGTTFLFLAPLSHSMFHILTGSAARLFIIIKWRSMKACLMSFEYDGNYHKENKAAALFCFFFVLTFFFLHF